MLAVQIEEENLYVPDPEIASLTRSTRTAPAFLTPEMVHYGLADQALAERHVRLLEAYHAHPERFVKGPPKLRTLNRAVYINPQERNAPVPPEPFPKLRAAERSCRRRRPSLTTEETACADNRSPQH
jgi:hypothetical protein